MSNRQKHICDKIMYAITTAEGQTKFGLSGMTTIFNGKASDEEVAEAVQYLIENNYLRMLGKYVFGIGVSGDLKDYDLSGFDPFAALPGKPEVPLSIASTDHYKGDGNTAKRPPLSGIEGKKKEPAKADEKRDESPAADIDQEKHLSPYEKGAIEHEFWKSEQQQIHVHNIDEIPSITANRDHIISDAISKNAFDALERLEQKLNPAPIANVAVKLAILNRLAVILKPLDSSISEVLHEIQADYTSHSII